MRDKKKLSAIILLVMIAGICLAAWGCSPADTTNLATGTAAPISVNNDTVETGESGLVSDPEAGKILKPVQSSPEPLEPGTTAAPPADNPAPDLLAATTGTPPVVAHGDANGLDCAICHSTGTGGAIAMPQNHVDAGLTSDLCTNCHQF
jgi:hypothetical protein